jgi:hypothetical protein
MQSPTDQEDAYFRKQDQELRQKLREELGQAAGDLKQAPRDLSLAGKIQKLGFVGDKVKVFDLMPLVHVAWADGSVSRQEREAILGVAGTRVPRTSVAFVLMESLLEERPPQNFLDESLSLLKLVAGDGHGKPPEDPRPASLFPVVAQRDLRRDPHAHRAHRVHAQRQRPHRAGQRPRRLRAGADGGPPFVIARDGEYVLLENPIQVEPIDGGSNGGFVPGGNKEKELKLGTKKIIPGPCAFPLWPGQSAEVRPAHKLGANQYLLVEVVGAVDESPPTTSSSSTPPS